MILRSSPTLTLRILLFAPGQSLRLDRVLQGFPLQWFRSLSGDGFGLAQFAKRIFVLKPVFQSFLGWLWYRHASSFPFFGGKRVWYRLASTFPVVLGKGGGGRQSAAPWDVGRLAAARLIRGGDGTAGQPGGGASGHQPQLGAPRARGSWDPSIAGSLGRWRSIDSTSVKGFWGSPR